MEEIKIYLLSINNISFNIPVYKYLIPFLEKLSNGNINIAHSRVVTVKDFNNSINTEPILIFNDVIKFNNQTIFQKIIKYLKINNKIISVLIENKINIIYSPDFEVIYFCLLYRIIFKKKKIIIIYHQFEMIENKNLKFPKSIFIKLFLKIANKIDLILIPEINRADYFKELTIIKDENILLFPNTCKITNNESDFNNTILKIDKNDHKIIAHIGALDCKNFFLNEYLECLSKINSTQLQLLFIGRITDEAKMKINSYPKLNTKIIDYIDHDELLKIYFSIDIGLILYKGISLNLELAAPNKLYEFWSYGIPVIAPRLKGLMTLFKEDFLGELVDFCNNQQLANSIERLLSDRILIKTKIKNYFEKNFTIDIYLEMLKKELEKKIYLITNG